MLYTTIPYAYPIAAMADHIPELPALEANNGGPWPWLVRRFLDDCAQVLREIRGLRLQSGRYPTRNEHISSCSCDASHLRELIQGWEAPWQFAYVVMRIAALGLYVHPDIETLEVLGVRVAEAVEEVQLLVSQRGYALGLLERALCGYYEAPWVGEEPHPLIALQTLTGEIDDMARAVLEDLMDEP
jgi:hypothetical protein